LAFFLVFFPLLSSSFIFPEFFDLFFFWLKIKKKKKKHQRYKRIEKVRSLKKEKENVFVVH